jgi:hypothetical protein
MKIISVNVGAIVQFQLEKNVSGVRVMDITRL